MGYNLGVRKDTYYKILEYVDTRIQSYASTPNTRVARGYQEVVEGKRR